MPVNTTIGGRSPGKLWPGKGKQCSEGVQEIQHDSYGGSGGGGAGGAQKSTCPTLHLTTTVLCAHSRCEPKYCTLSCKLVD